MTYGMAHLLRNTTARELIKALGKDGFVMARKTRTSARVFRHSDDGRMTLVHFHSSSDTFTPKTLQSIVDAVRWTEDDLRRLKLIRKK